MKTTIELPDALMVELKVAAARRRCSLRQLFERALRRELAAVDSRQRPPVPWTTDSGGLAPGLDVANREAMYEWIGRRR